MRAALWQVAHQHHRDVVPCRRARAFPGVLLQWRPVSNMRFLLCLCVCSVRTGVDSHRWKERPKVSRVSHACDSPCQGKQLQGDVLLGTCSANCYPSFIRVSSVLLLPPLFSVLPRAPRLPPPSKGSDTIAVVGPSGSSRPSACLSLTLWKISGGVGLSSPSSSSSSSQVDAETAGNSKSASARARHTLGGDGGKGASAVEISAPRLSVLHCVALEGGSLMVPAPREGLDRAPPGMVPDLLPLVFPGLRVISPPVQVGYHLSRISMDSSRARQVFVFCFHVLSFGCINVGSYGLEVETMYAPCR